MHSYKKKIALYTEYVPPLKIFRSRVHLREVLILMTKLFMPYLIIEEDLFLKFPQIEEKNMQN